MSIALEHIAPNDWPAVQRLVEALGRLVIDTGGVSVGIRFGSGTLTWPGGTPYSDTLTLAHGLGRSPVAAIATNKLAAGTLQCTAGVVAVDATNVQWRGYATDDSSPAAATTQGFYWVAIG